MRKKLLSIAIALALCLGLAVPAMADESTGINSYYYQQLDAYGKELYDAVLADMDSLQTEGEVTIKKTNLSETDKEGYLQAAFPTLAAFYLDHPEVLWVINDRRIGHTESISRNDDLFDDDMPHLEGPWDYTSTLTIDMTMGLGCNWKSGNRSIENDSAFVNSKVAEIVAAAQAAGSSRYDQVKYVHNWLVANNTYNSKAAAGGAYYVLTVDATQQTPISALDPSLSPVCEGYSRAFKLICDRLGIPCIMVTGQGRSAPHAWNYVQMEDGTWYAEDATWDWFLYGSGDDKDHIPSSDWQLPALSKTACPGPVAQPAKPAQSATSKFTDVSADAYYAKPVTWAVERGITGGTSATTFSPNQTCTRGQIVTFLYRSAGSPTPSGTTSVSDAGNTYYSDAVLWAAEKGLFSGSSFSPESPCTREMAVDFMWKYAGKPNAAVANFSDVSSPAVNWAAEQGITGGTSATTFSPNDTCTRGQIVTFLYRGFAE